jgi:hypothetical protein
MSRANRLLVASLAALALIQSGCLMLAAGAVGGGAVGVAIATGTAKRDFYAPVDATAIAAQAALQDLGLPVERPHLSPTHAEIDSTLSTGGAVLLTLKELPRPVATDPPTTRVEIHIKVFGDKKISERILDQINHRLRNPAPPAATQPTGAAPPPPLPPQTEEPGLAPNK